MHPSGGGGGGQVQPVQPVQSQPLLSQSAQLVVGTVMIKSSHVWSATHVVSHPAGGEAGGAGGPGQLQQPVQSQPPASRVAQVVPAGTHAANVGLRRVSQSRLSPSVDASHV